MDLKIRSTKGQHELLAVPPSTTLAALKEQIGSLTSLGPARALLRTFLLSLIIWDLITFSLLKYHDYEAFFEVFTAISFFVEDLEPRSFFS
jgi:hypothetical protein